MSYKYSTSEITILGRVGIYSHGNCSVLCTPHRGEQQETQLEDTVAKRQRTRKTKDKWFGVTYKEDKEAVVKSFKKLISDGVYREELYSDIG